MTHYKVKRIRGRQLQEIRRKHFENDPLCADCKKRGIYRLATQLDHIIALTNGGQETKENRQGLCDDCHDIKTAKDLSYTMKTKIGEDGFPIETKKEY